MSEQGYALALEHIVKYDDCPVAYGWHSDECESCEYVDGKDIDCWRELFEAKAVSEWA